MMTTYLINPVLLESLKLMDERKWFEARHLLIEAKGRMPEILRLLLLRSLRMSGWPGLFEPFEIDEEGWLNMALQEDSNESSRKVSESEISLLISLLEQQTADSSPSVPSATAQLLIGLWFDKVRKQAKDGAEWYRHGGEAGSARAQFSYGWCCMNGSGLPEDKQEGFRWYKLSAEQGDHGAINNLGVCYRNGRGTERNTEKAIELYRNAAERGNPLAQRNLGLCHLNGWGCKKDPMEAERWFIKAAMQLNPDAMISLITLYDKGEGPSFPPNFTEASRWLALIQEYSTRKLDVASVYFSFGERDKQSAAKWYTLAAQQMDPFTAFSSLLLRAAYFRDPNLLAVQILLVSGCWVPQEVTGSFEEVLLQDPEEEDTDPEALKKIVHLLHHHHENELMGHTETDTIWLL